MQNQFDRNRFADLVLYVCNQVDPDTLGAVKLHKALYLADMFSYANTGKALTGETYRKRQYGPTSHHLISVLEQLEQGRKLRIEEHEEFPGYRSKRFYPLDKPAADRFTKAEQELIDGVIDFVVRHSASEISDLTHTPVWEAAEMGEELPYNTIFHMFPADISEEDREWAKKEAKKIAG